MLPPVDILDCADITSLSMSQRCSFLYLRAVRDFVRTLARLSEAVFTPGAAGLSGVRPLGDEAIMRLEALLKNVRLPPLAYVPLCRSSEPLRPVTRITPCEGSVFVTRARASVLLMLEVVSDPHGRKLSELFSAVKDAREAIADDLSSILGGLTQPPLRQVSAEAAAAALEAGQSNFGGSGAGVFGGVAGDEEDDDDEARGVPPIRLRERPLVRIAPTSTFRASQSVETLGTAPTSAGEASAGEGVLDRVFGESWAAKTRRIRKASPAGHKRGWALLAMISKANDDVRQEVFVMQCLRFFHAIFPTPLWLRTYRILATGPSSGLIEMITDTTSLDRLKRRPGYTTLRAHFEAAYGGADSPAFAAAQLNFACSLAAASVVSYVLAIKDRHNGNLLLDRRGHLMNIDFGYILGQNTKIGLVSGESAVPFKLTREFVDVLGGPSASLFTETFVDLCTAALRAIRDHADTLVGLTEVTMLAPALPCFQGTGRTPIEQMRKRLMLQVPDHQLRDRVRALIAQSLDHLGTKAYDRIQKVSFGIEA